MKFLAILAFVILTNPLWGQSQKWTLIPEPSSLTEVHFGKKFCTNFGGDGVGCSQAILRFQLARSVKKNGGHLVDVVFHEPPPRDGEWSMTIRFNPQKCSLAFGVHNNNGDFWRCRDVSWRLAPR